ncbi:hypothetical protein HPB51_015128 [Rhipicephalus microplus]|uniref:Cytochrome n=1 Tax=Rhipicephalus microplus TaxID=6941 RepID=A0A9J6DP03_RHIMP|nr:hypothetical protein HPB51_015128 [Rhipicephalus microplus]
MDQDLDIIAVQETKVESVDATESLLQRFTGRYTASVSHAVGRSAGCVIFVRNSLGASVQNVTSDSSGRGLKFSSCIDDRYITRNRNYWAKQDVPHENLSLIIRPLIKVLTKEMNFADPILNNMMVFARLDRWRRIRPASSPAFTTGKLRKMHALIQDCVKITCEHLSAAAEEARDDDMKRFYGHYALDVIARCAFGTQLDSQANATNQFVMASEKAFKMDFSPTQIISMLFPGLLESLNIKVKTTMRYNYFRELFQQIMDERNKNNRRIEDFLQLMIEAKQGRFTTAAASSLDAESKLFDMGSEAKSEAKSLSNALTEDEALAQCLVFFLAGQDTTSSTLAGAVYYLALNSEVQEKLRREADKCFQTHGPEPSLDVVSKLKYLHCVVSEALRMLPAVPRTQRIASQDYVLADTGIRIPKGLFCGRANLRHASRLGSVCRTRTVQSRQVPLQIKQSLGTLRIEGAFVGIRKRLDNST